MAEIKTKATNASVEEFLKKVEPQQKQDDAFVLLGLFKKITGEKAVMWGPSMIGFGMFHYKSERSTQEGDWPRAAFSPRKQNLTLYVITSETDPALLKRLGKHKTGVSCLYINKLADVDIKIVEKLIQESWDYMNKLYPTT